MIDDKTVQFRHLIVTACNLWLQGREVKSPDDFYVLMERIKRGAASAKDESALHDARDRLLALTEQLAPEDWKEYEGRVSSAEAKKIIAGRELKRELIVNLRSGALRNF